MIAGMSIVVLLSPTYLHGWILGRLHPRLQHRRLLLMQLQVTQVLRKRRMVVLDLGVADLGPRGLEVPYFIESPGVVGFTL